MYKLRLLHKDDLSTRVDWMNQPEIYESMSYDLPITLEKTIQWFTAAEQNPNRWDFVLELDSKVVAMSGLIKTDHEIDNAETYIFVNPAHKHQGIGKVMHFLRSIYAFKILKLKKIIAIIDADNYASRINCEKLGFVTEGVHRKEKIKNGVLIDRIYYGCFEHELNINFFNYSITQSKEIIIL